MRNCKKKLYVYTSSFQHVRCDSAYTDTLLATRDLMAYSSNFTNAHLATGVCVVVSPGRCNDKRRGVVDEEGEEDAHEQGGQFHHPPHILLPLSPSLHCAAFRGALAVGRPLWPQLLATPAHEADCTRRQRVKLASKLYQHCI